MLIFKLRVYSYDIITSKGYFENERRMNIQQNKLKLITLDFYTHVLSRDMQYTEVTPFKTR